MNAPCYRCARRAINCHTACTDYVEYRKVCNQIQTAREAERRIDAADSERGDKIRKDVRKNGLYNQRKGRKRRLILTLPPTAQLSCTNVTLPRTRPVNMNGAPPTTRMNRICNATAPRTQILH